MGKVFFKSYEWIMSAVISCMVYCYWQNNDIVVTKYYYRHTKKAKALTGFRMAHVSDLHNKDFQRQLIRKIEEVEPDIIVVTGDIVDRRRPNPEISMRFVKEALKIAPVYYVPGNHEAGFSCYDLLCDSFVQCGATVLNNESASVSYHEEEIYLIGVADPILSAGGRVPSREEAGLTYRKTIEVHRRSMKGEAMCILLTHHPEYFSVYAQCDVDLALAGHAHGGQIRLPLVGSIYAPHQGFFPKYASGLHTMHETTLVISRGLGNSKFPIRLGNRPELVVIEFAE